MLCASGTVMRFIALSEGKLTVSAFPKPVFLKYGVHCGAVGDRYQARSLVEGVPR